MIVLTAGQAAALDRGTIEGGTPGIELMRNAGDAVFDVLRGEMFALGAGDAVVAAGTGNNGGDGFRVAYRLREYGIEPAVFLIGKKEKVKGDALVCMRELENDGMKVVEIADSRSLGRHAETFLSASLIVDALFGTGLRGEIEGIPARIVDLMNASRAKVVSVDIPSGVDASTGAVAAHSVSAQVTVTFGTLKAGHVMQPGRLLCGTVRVADIGFSPDVLDAMEPFGHALTVPEAARLLPRRHWDAHKNSAGRVFFVAGSAGMTGAAALAAESAYRVGAGIVRVGCPESLHDILEVKLTESLTVSLPEVRKRRCLSLRAMGMLRETARNADAVAIGPGLGIHRETSELVRRFVGEYEGKIVIDADAINAFAGQAELLLRAPGEKVLTPHSGELSRLTGTAASDIMADPVAAARSASRDTGAVVLLKGPNTVIAEPSGRVWLNGSGTSDLATAGAGDVLTGIIAGLMAQGLSASDAAVPGAYLHGLCGERASSRLGGSGVLAGDLPGVLPEVVSGILTGR